MNVAVTESSADTGLHLRHVVTPVLLALIFLALLNIGNEIRYQGCISRQVQEERLFVEGHEQVRPVQCHRLPF